MHLLATMLVSHTTGWNMVSVFLEQLLSLTICIGIVFSKPSMTQNAMAAQQPGQKQGESSRQAAQRPTGIPKMGKQKPRAKPNRTSAALHLPPISRLDEQSSYTWRDCLLIRDDIAPVQDLSGRGFDLVVEDTCGVVGGIVSNAMSIKQIYLIATYLCSLQPKPFHTPSQRLASRLSTFVPLLGLNTMWMRTNGRFYTIQERKLR